MQTAADNPYASPQSKPDIRQDVQCERPVCLKVCLWSIGAATLLMVVEDVRTLHVAGVGFFDGFDFVIRYTIAAVGIWGLSTRRRWVLRAGALLSLVFLVASIGDLYDYLRWVETNRAFLDPNSYSLLQLSWGGVAYTVTRQVAFIGCMGTIFAMLLCPSTRHYFGSPTRPL